MSGAPPVEVRAVEVFDLRVPFRRPFSHNLATHKEARPQIVRLTLSNGVCGYGEAQPRPYLTGETLESVAEALSGPLKAWVLGRHVASLGTAAGLLSGAEASQLRWAQPAAFCALELALLDAVGQSEGRSALEVLGPVRRTQLTYDGAVIGFMPLAALGLYLGQIRKQGKRLVKIKVGQDSDAERLAAVRRGLGPEVQVVLDANGAWSADEAISRIRALEPFGLTAVEQPVAREDVAGMARVRREVRTPVMADESLCTLADAQRLLEAEACDMWNVRIGKCGGLLGTQEILRLAHSRGIRCSLGVLVGETPILGSAGRLLAASEPQLWHLEFDSSGSKEVEGGIPPLLALESNVATVDPSLPGMGLRIDAQRFEALVMGRGISGDQKVKQA